MASKPAVSSSQQSRRSKRATESNRQGRLCGSFPVICLKDIFYFHQGTVSLPWCGPFTATIGTEKNNQPKHPPPSHTPLAAPPFHRRSSIQRALGLRHVFFASSA